MSKNINKQPLRYTIRMNAARDDVTVKSDAGEIQIDRAGMSKVERGKLAFRLTKAFREVYSE